MQLMHNVYFSLKDKSPDAVRTLVEACHKYLTVQPGITHFAAGPRETDLTREVNDQDWDVGLHVQFTDRTAHDAYQDDATHNVFIAQMKANWSKVRVFDSLV